MDQDIHFPFPEYKKNINKPVVNILKSVIIMINGNNYLQLIV